jgi:hypothetical protein
MYASRIISADWRPRWADLEVRPLFGRVAGIAEMWSVRSKCIWPANLTHGCWQLSRSRFKNAPMKQYVIVGVYFVARSWHSRHLGWLLRTPFPMIARYSSLHCSKQSYFTPNSSVPEAFKHPPHGRTGCRGGLALKAPALCICNRASLE